MIVTVTANTTFDQTVFVPSFQPGTTITASRTAQSMGGKPTDASFILGRMGVKSLALGFKAGVIGQKIDSMLREFGVETDFIEVGGESRVNIVIVDEATGEQTTIITSSLVIPNGAVAELQLKLGSVLQTASVMVVGGSLPEAIHPRFYRDVIAQARNMRVPVVFDAYDDNLREGLQSRPDYIKPNHHELGRFVGRSITSVKAAYEAGREILDQYGSAPIITMGEDGALAVLQDRAYFIPPIKVDVVSAAGAGDAVLAGIAASIHEGKPIEDGLRLGIATATAVLLQAGTATYEVEDMRRFLPQVDLVPYP